MGSFLLLYCFVFSLVYPQTVEYLTTNCVTVEGAQSGRYDDDQSVVDCSDHQGYTLVSCGVYSEHPEIDGAKHTDTTCTAYQGYNENPDSSYYVKAIGRCCLLESSATCTKRQGGKSGTNDDAYSQISCQSDEYLTGCTVYTEAINLDGCWSNGDYSTQPEWCRGVNGADGQGVWSYAQCCSYSPTKAYTMELECYRAKSSLSGTGDDAKASVSCNSGYFMAGCSGEKNDQSIEGWYITSDHKCQAINKFGGSGVYAYGICCREKKTTLPTQDPTKDPTNDPTINPTTDPTIDPTIDPTTEPTIEPTIIPTLNPSITPTTITPSSNPSIIPTNVPSDLPSNIPSKNPTQRPNSIISTTLYPEEGVVDTTANGEENNNSQNDDSITH